MKTKITKEAIKLIDEVLRELDSTKCSLQVAIQKMSRAAILIDNIDLNIWCEIQLGNKLYTKSIIEYTDAIIAVSNNKSKSSEDLLKTKVKKLKEIGIKQEIHLTSEELIVKHSESGGGYLSIGFIEDTYTDLVRTKAGNDGTYYKNNLLKHLAYVKRSAHEKATTLFKELSFADVPQSVFETLKVEVEDKLLDFNPELAEMLMISFQNVSTNNSEEWSQAFVTCRRFLECLADNLFQPREEKYNGRAVGQSQYLNRIWAFMDKTIESNSNRELAKAHLDLIGSYMQSIYKLYNKGVHSDITKIESTKVVFHTYLLIADLLNYINAESTIQNKKYDINTMSLDEIEAVFNIKRAVAKEIVKYRIMNGDITVNILSEISGIGPKTFKKIVEILNGVREN